MNTIVSVVVITSMTLALGITLLSISNSLYLSATLQSSGELAGGILQLKTKFGIEHVFSENGIIKVWVYNLGGTSIEVIGVDVYQVGGTSRPPEILGSVSLLHIEEGQLGYVDVASKGSAGRVLVRLYAIATPLFVEHTTTNFKYSEWMEVAINL